MYGPQTYTAQPMSRSNKNEVSLMKSPADCHFRLLMILDFAYLLERCRPMDPALCFLSLKNPGLTFHVYPATRSDLHRWLPLAIVFSASGIRPYVRRTDPLRAIVGKLELQR
mmetsp:Transcript_5186/g.10970  ORF Transcript_5186/g.10970 Transcript_5186/m.10970 type:complete len:112 (-) Transcript_5186:1500-1835(-)